ncbi:antibiotic biosynthesis monooxygenase [Olivibacter sp. SDN3]|uniref:putative quinol monooxygenase n=1 Tax=Olivibacter sp. SDN3 TaxID=2764720 RepID=UPI001650DBDE|nr:putative quinol monooxygenase [Olivibacter sp. SDN3]QNL48735.1 antibiotic biosynthesis monooxygenase [Olivibacter sp. SDN3]
MIYITAIVKSKPKFVDEVKSILDNMVIQSRKEEACIRYDLHQGMDNESLFVFYEIWQNQAGLDRHNEQPYIKAFGASVPEKLEEVPTIYLTRKL